MRGSAGQPGINILDHVHSFNKQIDENLHLLRAIVQLVLDSVLVVDADFRIIFVNKATEKLYGYSREELVGKDPAIFNVDPDKEIIHESINQSMRSGNTWAGTILSRRKDGTTVINSCQISPLFNGKGDRIGAISIRRDITEHKQMAQRQKILSQYISARPATSLQKRFIREGLQYFEDRQIVELLLSFVLPPGKANRLAWACIEKFKNLRDFLAASPGELQQIGISPACQFSIKLLHELPTKVLQEKIKLQSVYKSSKAVFDYLYYSMRDLKKEVFKVIYLDSQNRIIDTNDLFEGARDIISIRPRYIVENAIIKGATGLIFVHNHPGGDPTPSRSDKQLTRDLVFVGYILQIKVLDQIIIGQDRYFSFADEGLIEKYEDEFLNLKIKGALAARPSHRRQQHLLKTFHS